MLRFSFKKKDNEFKHIAHGLIPAASIAPKPAVPRTPPPRSPDPSPERTRSALAAAILSSSLTGQTWAIPPARPRSFSESDRSESFRSDPDISPGFYTRDQWSEALDSQPRLSSPDPEEELEDKEKKVEKEDDRGEHVYQTVGSEDNFSGPVYSLPQKSKITAPKPTQMPHTIVPSADFADEATIQSRQATCDSSKKKASVRKSPGRQKEDVPSMLTTDHLNKDSQAKTLKHPTGLSPNFTKAHSDLEREAAHTPLEKNTSIAERQKLLEKRLQRLEHEISHSEASPNLRSSSGSQAELKSFRQHAQELVDENDALKLTVHRLNMELSRYQTLFRPMSKQEKSDISGLPKTGPPPPWPLDMKYLSPLVLAYEDRINEKDALLQTTEEQVKRLRLHVEEVIKENEQLHDEIAKSGGVNLKDCHQLQQQAILVLQENQILVDQLDAQHVKAKANHSKHQSEVSKVSKQLILLEEEKQHLQEDLEESRREVQKNMREIQVLQARLKDAVTWDEHCCITGKLRRQLEQQESRSKSEIEDLIFRVSSLQEESRSLVLDKANLKDDLKRMEAELKLTRQAHRKAERKMSVLKQQKEDCLSKEEKTRHYLEAVFSVAEHISRERDQLLHMVSILQQEKQGFISKILSGTVRFGKLQEEVKQQPREKAVCV
ncbi:centrosomal protein of 89 kDa isoform X3 [Betta splendens]|uniref:Centrosomal protein of 89 kDa isoform X3 n=1 Tax=Betta splendens TaxID=158456 RepID=A0A9W2XNZ9_BETSP|nr:centrosomal protein of 89 kDa isoform X3 [Betta splendens]XP_055363360.1 centrosomal protein of 89 kDa isoform X3 [Betta splendens]